MENSIGIKKVNLWTGPEVIKLFFLLNSTEGEIYHAHKC